jgi:polar amino acid transport system permease protein
VPEGLRLFLTTFFDPQLIASSMPTLLRVGLPNTLILAVLAIGIGLLVGVIVATGLLAPWRTLRFLARCYVDLFRGLPAIVTIYVIGQGLPLAGLHIFGASTYLYAALALGLIEGAYMSEMFRAGIQSVERGQTEGARSLGLSRALTMRYVVFPQGLRRVLPPLTGQFIIVIKGTALVYLLGLLPGQREMFAIAQDRAINAASLTPLVAAGFLYLVITVPLTYFVNRLDRTLRDGPRVEALAPARLSLAADHA